MTRARVGLTWVAHPYLILPCTCEHSTPCYGLSKPCNPLKPPATQFTCTKKATITVDRPGGGTGLGQHCAISSTGQRLESRGSLQMWVREFFAWQGVWVDPCV